MDKRQQETTKATLFNEGVFESGLTPIQEKAAVMLAGGESITSVAEMLGVNRTTIYQWLQRITFRCYLNIQKQEATTNLRNGLFALYNDALQVIRASLQSSNDSIRLKAAMMVIARVEATQIGDTDAKEVLRKAATHHQSSWSEMFDEIDKGEDVLDEKLYKTLLKENGFSVDE